MHIPGGWTFYWFGRVLTRPLIEGALRNHQLPVILGVWPSVNSAPH